MDKRLSQKPDKKGASRIHKRGIVGYSKKSALLEEAITHMNSGKYGRSSAALKELLALDPQNIEARRLFATLHLKLGSLVTARQAFESLANEAIGRQDYWLAESLLKEYLAAGPRCVPFLEQLAQVYQEKGDEIAAVVELGKAIEILRDDPDPEHPQKAAQLYSKIRELAPASSVAFQLAPLFDVQTGEFLVPLSATVATPTEQLPADISAVTDVDPTQAPREHPLPEVMPWELTDEQAAALSPQAER
ncbi:MAG TPA: tetratricopeptide repeat protein, partial [Nitrospira sp.]|nr:tetratricopeptide repeat protein [Nitrospira sp.]